MLLATFNGHTGFWNMFSRKELSQKEGDTAGQTRGDERASERARVGGVRVFDRFVVDWWWPWPTFKVRLVQQHGDSVGMGVGGVRKRRLILAN